MLHQAEKYIKQIVEEIGRPSYMQEFLKQGKDKKAIEDVAGKLKQFSENMSVLQPIAIKGFMVPSGSLMLFRYLQEELEVMEKMVQEDAAWEEERKAKANRNPGDTSARHREPDAMTAAFNAYSAEILRRKKAPSVLKQLAKLKAYVKEFPQKAKTREKERDRNR